MIKTSQTLIVCPPAMKQNAIEIESSNSLLQNIKIMSTNEVKENLFFSYGKKAIVYLCEKYSYTPSFAQDLINYLYYMNINDKYNEKKLTFLQKIKIELLSNKLLKENSLFKEYLKKVNVVFKYFDVFTNSDNFLFNKIKEYTNVNNESISTLEYKKLHTLYEFDTLEKECIYLFNSFSNLLEKGVNPENIILLNVQESSLFTLNRFAKFYNIALDLPNNQKIAHTPIGNEFISLLNSSSVEESLNIIKEKCINSKSGLSIYNAILNIINEYSELQNYDQYKRYIIEDLNKASLPKKMIANAIKVKDFSSYTYKDEDYVFVMNANYNVFPKIYKDEDYLNDLQKQKICMTTSLEKNEEEKQKIRHKLSKMNFPIVTYHLSTPFENCYPPFLKEEVENVIVNPSLDLSYSYSKIKDIYDLIKKKENKNFDEHYSYLHYHLNNFIKEYNPSYKAIPNERIQEYYNAKKGLQLSYSSMNTYYQCKYRFFIAKILKLDKFESSFATNIGNIFHEVLSKIYNSDFDLDKEYLNSCNKYNFNAKELFLLKKLKDELAFDIRVILDHYNEATLFKKQFFEKEIIINYESKNIPLSFKGIIDKTMLYEDESQKYIAIIDYKTGKAKIELENIEHGVGMQLPVYLYLANNNNEFKEYKFAGFYLQMILDDETKHEVGKTREELRQSYLKLVGYSTNNTSILSKFDNTYISSNYIKGMKYSLKNNDFYSYSKVLSEEEMNSFVTNVEEKIKQAFDNILNANFDIAPLEIDGKNIGCSYCEFKDICYKDYNKEVSESGNEMDE